MTALIVAFRSVVACAQNSAIGSTVMAGGATALIPPGTAITMQNWQQYRQFMPDGMAALFEGEYSWWKSHGAAQADARDWLSERLMFGIKATTHDDQLVSRTVRRSSGVNSRRAGLIKIARYS